MREIFEFLQKLDKNNNRQWFLENKSMYESAHAGMIQFADRLLAEMNKIDHIETESGKKCLYRIYRDVRFGKDKTPYKNNWAGGIRRATAELRGGYYFQIGPKEHFVMGGFFGPNAQDLIHIRKQIAQDPDSMRSILNHASFKEQFGELKGNQLKTAPRGFEKDHPAIDLLRYKQFVVRHDFTEAEVFHQDFPRTMAKSFGNMRPFLDYMSEILTTDLNGESLV